MNYLTRLQTFAKRNARIAALYGTGQYTLEDLATEFDMSKQRVSHIVRRQAREAKRNGKAAA